MSKVRYILKTNLLIIALLLSAMVRYAHAQVENTGASPYQDSKHAYRIVIDSVVNTQEWIITDGVNPPYDLTNGSCTWATYVPATTNGGYDVVHITFDHTVFTTGVWSLQYRETDRNHSCISAREFRITVVPNTFYLTLAADITNICNSQSDSSHLYSEVDAESFNTSVTYTVTMNKDDDFDPTSWGFDADFSQAVTVDSMKASDGTLTYTGSGSDYQINVTPSASNSSPVTVSITVSYFNPVTLDIIRNLDVSNGIANFSLAGAPDATTRDNITNFVDGSPNRQQAITILSIPSTLDILAGVGETATSASNPLQNSTHRYTVFMGLPGNYGNTGTGWFIETSAGAPIANDVANYELTRTQSATDDQVTIEFHMALGDYVLYYSEQGSNGCSAVREFPFAIRAPFDVDITGPAAPICSSASGVIFSDLTDTTTTVVYTVNLNTTSYGSDWSFGFALTSDQIPDFTVGDVDVTGITVTGGTYLGDNYSGTVSVLSTVSTVQISVTYDGFYVNPYEITATITPTGSFEEQDDGAGNSVTHTLYSMPQIHALAGVE